MKKLFLVCVLMSALVSFGFASEVSPYGIGNPYSRTASESGELYVNTSNNSIWKARSTTKGDWEKLPPLVGNGSADAPFQNLHVESFASPLTLSHAVIDSALVATFAADITVSVNVLVSSATSEVFTVADAVDGQELLLIYGDEAAGADTIVVTPDNMASGTTVLLENVSDVLKMFFFNGEWHIIHTTGTSS